MRFHIGSVDRARSWHRAGPRQGSRKVWPETAARPAIEAILDRREWTVFGRTITQGATLLENMDNPGDHLTIIDAPRAALVLRQARLYRRPLPVFKPELPGHPHPPERFTRIQNYPIAADSTR